MCVDVCWVLPAGEFCARVITLHGPTPLRAQVCGFLLEDTAAGDISDGFATCGGSDVYGEEQVGEAYSQVGQPGVVDVGWKCVFGGVGEFCAI